MGAESHAAHLDRNYRYQRHVYDVTREYYLLGRKRLVAGLAPPWGGSVLEIGCGTALNLIRAAARYPDARFFGVDLSRLMLATAADALARRGLSDRIRLGPGDATSFDPRAVFDSAATFDRVFFSYSLSMMPPWETALDHAAGLLARQGELHIVDFGDCGSLPTGFRRALNGWLAHFCVTPRDDMEQVLAALARRHHLTLSFNRLYRGYTYSAVLQRR